MGRRASSSISPGAIAAVILAIAVVAGAAFVFLGSESKAMDRAVELPAVDWQKEGGRTFAGGVYLVSGTLTNRHIEGEREIAVLSVETERGVIPIPLSIPLQAKTVNLERNSDYKFLIEIDQEGMPVVQEIWNL